MKKEEPKVEEPKIDKRINVILADILDSFDNFNHELESVANSDMTRDFKISEYNKIMDRAFEYHEQVLEKYKSQLDSVSFLRTQESFDHLREEYEYGYKNLVDGTDDLELSDYEDDDKLEAVIDKAISYPADSLDHYTKITENIKQIEDEPNVMKSTNLDSTDNLPVNLQINIKQIDDEPYEYEEDDEFYDCVEDPKEQLYKDNKLVEINYDTILEILKEKKDQDLIYNNNPTNYPIKALTDQNAYQPTSIEYSNSVTPKFITKCKSGGKKHKRPLNLRLYQEYSKLMKQSKPDISKDKIDKLWKSNKLKFQNMLMDSVELYGGDLLNDEHYFNIFSRTGGYMLMGGGACGGKFDRSSYDKANNPYGIGKTHDDRSRPKEQKKRTKPQYESTTKPLDDADDRRGNMSLLRGSDPTLDRPDNTDLSDPESWSRAVGDIATITYDTLADVFDFVF
tara:strand:+ start:1 stop:1359 length:1359 start_codon:yes stop_codon:yes gene_type:complete